MATGRVFVFSGPSGVGKSTIIEQIMAQNPNMSFSISATTRSPRPGEIDGKDYLFVSKEKFTEMINDDEFLEYAEFVGNYYGTPIKPVNELLNKGRDVLLDIELQGATNVMKKLPSAITVIIVPPSMEELEKRLKSRNTDSDEVIKGRLERARTDLKSAGLFDYQIVNDTVEKAVSDIQKIIDK